MEHHGAGEDSRQQEGAVGKERKFSQSRGVHLEAAARGQPTGATVNSVSWIGQHGTVRVETVLTCKIA